MTAAAEAILEVARDPRYVPLRVALYEAFHVKRFSDA
jgi:hypothetical protein